LRVTNRDKGSPCHSLPGQRIRSLSRSTVELDARLDGAAQVLRAIAAASIEMSELISLGRLYGQLGASRASTNTDGDVQKELDVLANDIFVSAFRQAPVGHCFEELSEPLVLDPAGSLALRWIRSTASSNIDANVSIGRSFRFLPVLANASSAEAHFLNQVGCRSAPASSFMAKTSLVFALGSNQTQSSLWTGATAGFIRRYPLPSSPRECAEYAINASNYRHWELPVRAFIDDCVQGAEGPLKRNHKCVGQARFVADAYRILLRGGIFLYPGDHRAGYQDGRLRLLYEPIRLPLSSNSRVDLRPTACVPSLTLSLQAFMPCTIVLWFQRQRSSS